MGAVFVGGWGYAGVTNCRSSAPDGRDHLRAELRWHGSGGHSVREVLRDLKGNRRLLWSRQIEKSNDRVQSEAVA